MLGRRWSDAAPKIEAMLLQALNDPEFAKKGKRGRSGHDYAYDALWQLLVEEPTE